MWSDVDVHGKLITLKDGKCRNFDMAVNVALLTEYSSIFPPGWPKLSCCLELWVAWWEELRMRVRTKAVKLRVRAWDEATVRSVKYIEVSISRDRLQTQGCFFFCAGRIQNARTKLKVQARDYSVQSGSRNYSIYLRLTIFVSRRSESWILFFQNFLLHALLSDSFKISVCKSYISIWHEIFKHTYFTHGLDYNKIYDNGLKFKLVNFHTFHPECLTKVFTIFNGQFLRYLAFTKIDWPKLICWLNYFWHQLLYLAYGGKEKTKTQVEGFLNNYINKKENQGDKAKNQLYKFVAYNIKWKSESMCVREARVHVRSRML